MADCDEERLFMLTDDDVASLENLLSVNFSLMATEILRDDSSYISRRCPLHACSMKKMENMMCFAMPRRSSVENFLKVANETHEVEPLSSFTVLVPVGVPLDPTVLRGWELVTEYAQGHKVWEHVRDSSGVSLQLHRSPHQLRVFHLALVCLPRIALPPALKPTTRCSLRVSLLAHQ